jgi:hypothetical protein
MNREKSQREQFVIQKIAEFSSRPRNEKGLELELALCGIEPGRPNQTSRKFWHAADSCGQHVLVELKGNHPDTDGAAPSSERIVLPF